MYQIKILISPHEGVSQVALQSDEKEGPSIEALAFFNAVQNPIQRLKAEVHKTISAYSEAGKGS